MANKQLIHHFETLAGTQNTGTLQVRSPDRRQSGSIAIDQGDIVYSIVDPIKDLAALYMMLAWEDGEVDWSVTDSPFKTAFRYQPDIVLVDFMKIENECGSSKKVLEFIDEAAVRMQKERHNTIEFPSLKQNIIFLEHTDGPNEGKQYPFEEGTMWIGTAGDCEMPIVDHTDSVSRRHCKAQVSRNGITLTDLGSTNASYVNGKMIEKASIKPGDQVYFGHLCLKVDMKVRRAEKTKVAVRTHGMDVPESAPLPKDGTTLEGKPVRRKSTQQVDWSTKVKKEKSVPAKPIIVESQQRSFWDELLNK